jgi:hypothetical protein
MYACMYVISLYVCMYVCDTYVCPQGHMETVQGCWIAPTHENPLNMYVFMYVCDTYVCLKGQMEAAQRLRGSERVGKFKRCSKINLVALRRSP